MGMEIEHLQRARTIDRSWWGVAVAAAAAAVKYNKKYILVTKKNSISGKSS